MVLTSSSRRRSRARPVPAMSRPNRRRRSGGRSNRDGKFENVSKPIGRPANDGPMNTSKGSRFPPRRPKKGALRGPGKRSRPRNRNALRSSSAGRTGFRSGGDGRTAAGVASGRSGPGTTAQRRHQRLRGTGITLPLRRCGPLSRPSREDLRKRVGACAFEAGLLRL